MGSKVEKDDTKYISVKSRAEICRRDIDSLNYHVGTLKREACIEYHIREHEKQVLEKNQLTKTIYLVKGEHGAYSDWTTWVICAYTEKEMAELHRDNANKRMAELAKLDYDEKERLETSNTIANVYDSKNGDRYYYGYNEATYSVEEVKLFVHLDEYLEANGV